MTPDSVAVGEKLLRQRCHVKFCFWDEKRHVWQRHIGLANCGVPYRIHLFSDLSLDSMPDYKTYIFPNLFLLNKVRIDTLRRKILRNGNVAIFGPAKGINGGSKISAEGISSLTGIDFKLLNTSCPRRVLLRNSHPAIGGLEGETYVDSLSYGTTVVPVLSKDYTEMGLASGLWTINNPGLILYEHGLGAAGNGRKYARGKKDYAAIWTFAGLPFQMGCFLPILYPMLPSIIQESSAKRY